jgi:hypothetical protein
MCARDVTVQPAGAVNVLPFGVVRAASPASRSITGGAVVPPAAPAIDVTAHINVSPSMKTRFMAIPCLVGFEERSTGAQAACRFKCNLITGVEDSPASGVQCCPCERELKILIEKCLLNLGQSSTSVRPRS